ncbi:MAG: aspartyl-tRNA(Asn)/glutamyl-tRNA(Gln) amidotransferase subunit C [Planctomycetota bacterium]|jgi:aspartyl-tRNA(Asn)/glutamyl-tRNA(Gln) amidotransferase subunit C
MSEDNQEAVKKCAALARIEISQSEIESLSEDFERIFEAFQGLAQLDVSDVEPMLGAVELKNILREDREVASLERDALLAPAPQPTDGFFGVPKTLESPS